MLYRVFSEVSGIPDSQTSCSVGTVLRKFMPSPMPSPRTAKAAGGRHLRLREATSVRAWKFSNHCMFYSGPASPAATQGAGGELDWA